MSNNTPINIDILHHYSRKELLKRYAEASQPMAPIYKGVVEDLGWDPKEGPGPKERAYLDEQELLGE